MNNGWVIASAVGNMVGRHVVNHQVNESQRVRVDVEAIYWDGDLSDLAAEVAAAEEGLSVQETLTKKVEMAAQRGVDRYTVFELHIKNVGRLPAKLEPMKYRVFLLSNEEQPIAASRVDAVLDATLQPGDDIRGMVYFPKIVAAGQSELKLAFEQMFGIERTR